MNNLIKVDNLKKVYKISERKRGLPGKIANLFVPKFKKKVAVDGISFTINEGEAIGFIGPNGAGKSTTIKMLSGILYPDEGTIDVDGLSPYKNRTKYVANIGVVFGQKSQLQWDLPVIDSFELLRRIYSIPKADYDVRLNQFKELLDLDSFIKQPVRQLSLGQRMRADIAAAFLHNPKIIFLDEPTIGLDVVAKEKIRDFIRHINKETNTTIIFTTHDMKDISETCDRLIIIDKGHIIYDGKFDEIVNKFSSERCMSIEFEKKYESIDIDNVLIKDINEYKKEIRFNTNIKPIKELINEINNKYDVKDFTVNEVDIDDIVIKIYETGEI
jgi:ABC-2 type transport system ATP-binding protein